MSIQIRDESCIGCGRCVEVCPGNLLKQDASGKAYIRHERDCWGCTSCIKACRSGAILFFLGADIGGGGSTLSVEKKGDLNLWNITTPQGSIRQIAVNPKESNQY
ncbi:MAG: ferredoxin family protein [Clostridiaceae bacterium]|nr:ferredoxin family protein [Clostridiaceae bacterium]